MEIRLIGKEFRKERLSSLLEVWESSVRATHDFLQEGHVDYLRPYVEQGLQEISLLFCMEHEGRPLAFLGMDGDGIEMLFVHADFRGQGVGSALMREALMRGAHRVDVNEQNPQAFAFYRRFGFAVVSRDPEDNLGLPYPILHCTLQAND